MAHADLPPDLGHQDLSGAANVFRNRRFVWLWTAQVLSLLASNMVLAALMAVVVSATGSLTANAVLILTFLVPAVLFSALAGVIIERTDARRVMLISNIGRAAGTLLFIFVAASGDTANVPLIYGINLLIATATAFFIPAELTAIPRIVERRHFMAANSVFILTINATFAVGFGMVGPILLGTAGAVTVYIVVAIMFALSAAAIVPIPHIRGEARPTASTGAATAGAAREVIDQMKEGIAFVRQHHAIAWSLTYLGIAASLIGVLGAIGPGYAVQILRLREEDFFFIMGPAGIGAVIGILFLNAFGRNIPKRLLIDIGLLAMGVTLIALASVRPVVDLLSPTVQPIETQLPEMLAPIISAVAVVVVIAILAGVQYAFVAIPSQTALQEELPPEVRGRTFGILNMLLSVASFLPVLVAPAIADLLNIVFEGAGIPVVMSALGIAILVAGVGSWRRNARLGLHQHDLGRPLIGEAPGTPDAAVHSASRLAEGSEPVADDK
jgi:MFS family permease